MAHPQDASVEDRLARLERMVEEIHRRLPPLDAGPAARFGGAPAADAHAAGDAARAQADPWSQGAPYREPRTAAPGRASALPPLDGLKGMDAQFWLNRLGIGILLLGVAFLFRYSIEQGWVTPERRVAFGALLGLGLLVAGMRMDETRRRFVPVLLGGGIATFYIVGFAAFYLYELIGYGTAFAGMVGVTALAFGLALRKEEPSLGVLGALGGLGTPMILGISHGTPLGFSVYVSALLLWTCALYLLRGWKPVLWTSLAGGWLLLLTYGVQVAGFGYDAVPAAARGALQGAVALAWLGTGVLPFVRELRVKARAMAAAAAGEGVVEEEWDDRTLFHWHGLSLLPPLLALGVTAVVWEPSAERWGMMALAVAAAYQAAALALRERDEHLPDVLTLSASVFLAVGSTAAFSGDVLLLVLAMEGVGLVALSRRHGGRLVSGVGYALFGTAGVWTLVRLALGPDLGAREPLVDLAVVALALALSYVEDGREAVVARYFAHVAFLGWLWRELAGLPDGQAYATVAWAVYGVVLIVAGMRRSWPAVERVGILTLLMVAAKLFLVDLAALEAIWRVLLFLGVGGGFLFLSYWLQSLRRAAAPGEAAAAPAPGPLDAG